MKFRQSAPGPRGRVRRGWLVACAALALALHVDRVPAAAQLTTADSAAVLVSAAEELAAEGHEEAAIALLRYVLERYGPTPAAMRAQATLERLTRAAEAGDGRVELQVWGATYGLWLGVAVPAAFGAESSEAYGVGLLVGGPAGFLGGSSLATARRASTGQARAITLGGTWGTWQGWGWAEVLDWGTQEICDFGPCFEQGGEEEKFAGAILGGLTGIVVGAAVSGREVGPGQATTINFGALWGTWFGLAGGVLLDLEDDALLASTLLGGNAGLVGSALAWPNWRLSRSRARLISIAGVIGGLGGAGLDLLFQPDSEKVAIGIPLGTSIVGLAIGAAQTRDRVAADGPGSDGESALGALLSVDGEAWRWGLPLPQPNRVTLAAPGRDVRTTALRVPLFQARF